MRIAIVSSMLHPRFGGPPSVVSSHAGSLSPHHDVRVFGCATLSEREELLARHPGACLMAPAWPGWWMRAPGLADELVAWRPDVVHCHDVWLHGLYASWHASRRLRVPLVLTLHGIFTAPWRYRSLHKRLYRMLIFDRIARGTSAIHALNRFEALTALTAGLPDRCEVIPNGIPAAEFAPTDRWAHRTRLDAAYPVLAGRRILLYFGRLWSEKGLDILPACWSEVRRDGWVLVIAGPDYRGYRARLEHEITARGLGRDVVLTGPVSGNAKRDLICGSDLFILPSHGEGFSMAVIEAIAAGMPCILTTPCHFPELAQAGGGWECADDQTSVTHVLRAALATPPESLADMGLRARTLGAAHYTAEAVAERLSALYVRLVGGRP